MRKSAPPWIVLGILLILKTPFSSHAQTDSIAYVFQDAIENAVANNDDLNFDYDTEYEYLKDFLRHPLNINKASQTDFENLRLLTPEQIKDILKHREKKGGYITLYELQAVLGLETVLKIHPFVMVDSDYENNQIPVSQWFKRGKHDIFMRAGRVLEDQKGYNDLPNSSAATTGGYQGNPLKFYTRYRYSFNTRLSYGFTLEQDAGEKWASPLLDFHSFHFKINDLKKGLKTLCLGDYSVSFGQGLIHENGFSLGKSSAVLGIEKNNLPIKQYTASNENNFMRGAAAQVKIGRNTEGVFFASYRKRDGNEQRSVYEQRSQNLDNDLIISSLQFSGLHRTTNEIDDKNKVSLMTFGSRILKNIKKGSIAFNTIFNQFDKKIEPRNEPYNFFVFKGKTLLNFSTDYKYTVKNFRFFGETAMSDNGGYGTLNGLLLGVDKTLSFSVLQRFFSKNYQTLNAQPFAESSHPQDESGVYMGLELKPNRRWTISGYADFWQHQWWRFRVDAPSNGTEFFIKTAFRYFNTEGYLQVRHKIKQQNAERPDSAKVNTVVDKSKTQIRFQFQYKLSKQLELRNRLEWSVYQDEKTMSKGFMVYQDVILKPEKRPFNISSRLAFFDTNDYQSAIYAYENDLLYNFTILPYYYRGSRFYINVGYDGLKKWLFELRFANTRLANRMTIGSGLDEIMGNHRNDLKAQVRFTF
jgi:Helix-hairpin-helix motif